MSPDIFLGAGLAFLATALGAAGVFAFRKLDRATYPAIASFCGGVMAFSALEMLIGSHALAGDAGAFLGLLAGFMAFLLLERVLPHAHVVLKKEGGHGHKKKAILLAGTITLHNIPEGFAIASAFATAPGLGWLVSLSMALQDIPEGIVVSAPLAYYGVGEKRSFMWGAFSGVVEFLAAVLGYVFLSAMAAIIPVALAFSAGAMLYVVFFELLADAFRGANQRATAIAFVAGLAAAFLMSAALGF